MRPGLVAVGIALLAVGAVLAVSAFSLPGSTYTGAQTSQFSAPNIPLGQNRTFAIPGVNTTSGTFVISWLATRALTVTIYAAVACSAPGHYCDSGRALISWRAVDSGNWTRSGTLTFPYLMSMENPGVNNATLSGSRTESGYVLSTVGAPTWEVITILLGAILLAVIGGLSLFLGLFLRSGVYSEPESVTPRYAHELARPGQDPLDEPFEEDLDSDEDDGPVPPRPH